MKNIKTNHFIIWLWGKKTIWGELWGEFPPVAPIFNSKNKTILEPEPHARQVDQ